MDCHTFQRKLEDYREGSLDFPTRFNMERHARQCFLCGKDLNDAETLGLASRALARVPAPPDFEAALLARVSRESVRGRFRITRRFRMYNSKRYSPAVLATGLLCLVMAFGILFSIQRFSPAGSPSSPAMVADQPARVPSLPVQLSPSSTQNPDAAAMSPKSRVVTEVPRQHGLTGRYPEERVWSPMQGDQAEPEFKEYVVPGPGNRQFIMRLPKTIRMQYGQPSEEYFIRNVSH